MEATQVVGVLAIFTSGSVWHSLDSFIKAVGLGCDSIMGSSVYRETDTCSIRFGYSGAVVAGYGTIFGVGSIKIGFNFSNYRGCICGWIVLMI